MSLSTAAKVAGATGIVGGATMLTIGAINANTAMNSQGVEAEEAQQLDSLEQQLADYGATVDMSRAREDAGAAASHVDRWQGAGLMTAIAGGVGVVAGLAGMLTPGPVGAALRSAGIGAGVVAGGAALYGLNSYLRVGEHSERALAEIHGQVDSAVAQLEARQAARVAVAPSPATAVGTTERVDLPPALSAPVHDAIAAAHIEWYETHAAEDRPIGEFVEDLQMVDASNQEVAPGMQAAMRRAIAGFTGVSIPATGPVDWHAVATELDGDANQLLDATERAGARSAMYVTTYATFARDVGRAIGDPGAPYEDGFLAAALDGSMGEDFATVARMFVMSVGVDLRGDVDSGYLDELQGWAMDIAARTGA